MVVELFAEFLDAPLGFFGGFSHACILAERMGEDEGPRMNAHAIKVGRVVPNAPVRFEHDDEPRLPRRVEDNPPHHFGGSR